MLFTGPAPRVFSLPPGVDFPAAFAAGLKARAQGLPPEALGRVEIIVNASRAAQSLTAALARALAPGLLPRVVLLSDIAARPEAPELPPAVDRLRRMLRLSELVRAFLESTGSFAPVSARFDLASSLAELLDEMQGWAVPPDRLEGLDVEDHSAHWQTTLAFLRIVARAWPAMLEEGEAGALDPEARQRAAVEGLAARWAAEPPQHPVIVAGSTGSRAATAELMQAVARLPQGALVLPGFDAHLPGPVWAELPPDHPQASLGRLLTALGLDPERLESWHGSAPDPERARLVSLALRPAPVTDAWRDAVPRVAAEAAAATASLSLIEADTAREEALSIALAMRETLERPGARVALVTPDRVLARQVTAALARWDIRPDDTAGRPLSLTAPGIFLRLAARIAGRPAAPDALIALLKHPLAGGAGSIRRDHMLTVSTLERDLRDEAVPEVTPDWLTAWAERRLGKAERSGRPVTGGPEALLAWAAWLAGALAPLTAPGPAELTRRAATLRAAAEALCAGVGGGPAEAARLWALSDGEAAERLFARLEEQDRVGASLGATDLARLMDELMQAENVPPSDPGTAPDRRVMILGALEARMQVADRLILAGLNDGTWPKLPGADPWLSRPMRAALGLPLPERQVGLSAHDFQTGASAGEVILSRAKRVEGTPTIASRWLIRLTNLLEGSGTEGVAALKAMTARGDRWRALARRLDRPAAGVKPEPRPAPRPPVEARPRALSVTQIETLIRDPYAIYARHVLGLRALDPLGRPPDARDRGQVLHAVMERFVAETEDGLPEAPRALFERIVAEEIDAETPWPAQRRLWRGRMARGADWFLEQEAARRELGRPLRQEGRGVLTFELPAGPFTLKAKADRLDRLTDGTIAILDYKTGSPPTKPQMRAYARQLWLEAAIARAGGFSGIPRAEVSELVYIGLPASGTEGKVEQVVLGPGELAEDWQRFVEMMARFDDPDTPYTARLRPDFLSYGSDYDHLSRKGEWDDGEDAE
ncbi:double-strand break repair protein AddB [Oceanicella sp. SM1341]|uniref:double-strand break repair protein AddB n=1 Tax=Oceanicella sp. SM1341 TaxID=1548889 RepID=UPI0013004894|nr:double-strand break repair protein AddB [Oceanicella sp. SM1341]